MIALFVWLYKVLKFAGEHPDIAVLEGAEWSGYQRFQAAAKGFIPAASEPIQTASGETSLAVTTTAPKQPEEGQE